MLNLPKDKNHLTCSYCSLTHPSVEAGGIWHCPNPICPGCGGTALKRILLSSCKEDDKGITIDMKELKQLANTLLADIKNDYKMEMMKDKKKVYNGRNTKEDTYNNVLINALHDRDSFAKAIKKSIKNMEG